jgi:hypothetical protein
MRESSFRLADPTQRQKLACRLHDPVGVCRRLRSLVEAIPNERCKIRRRNPHANGSVHSMTGLGRVAALEPARTASEDFRPNPHLQVSP